MTMTFKLSININYYYITICNLQCWIACDIWFPIGVARHVQATAFWVRSIEIEEEFIKLIPRCGINDRPFACNINNDRNIKLTPSIPNYVSECAISQLLSTIDIIIIKSKCTKLHIG